MLTDSQILAFLLTTVVLTLTPGSDNLMVLSMGMSKGRRTAIAFGLGCALGCLSHTLLAVVGVGALIAASPMAFLALKMAGGGYLIWLGVQALRHASVARVPAGPAGEGPALVAQEPVLRTFAKGLLANAINPKVVLFFLSLLPQFVDASRGQTQWQLAQLGLLFTAQAAVLFSLLALFSGTLGGYIQRRPGAGVWMNRLAGTVFVGLGVRMMVAR